MIVDLVHENMSKLSCSLSSYLSYDDKNHGWENIVREISEANGTFRKMSLRNGPIIVKAQANNL